MTACYIDSSFTSLLYYAAKYGRDDPEQALLRSTNAGGENVARGALIVLCIMLCFVAFLGCFTCLLQRSCVPFFCVF